MIYQRAREVEFICERREGGCERRLESSKWLACLHQTSSGIGRVPWLSRSRYANAIFLPKNIPHMQAVSTRAVDTSDHVAARACCLARFPAPLSEHGRRGSLRMPCISRRLVRQRQTSPTRTLQPPSDRPAKSHVRYEFDPQSQRFHDNASTAPAVPHAHPRRNTHARHRPRWRTALAAAQEGNGVF